MQVINQYNLEADLKTAKEILSRTTVLEELDINVHKMAKLKKKILSWL